MNNRDHLYIIMFKNASCGFVRVRKLAGYRHTYLQLYIKM